MRFDQAIDHPAGSIIRRTAWPLHWWVTIFNRADLLDSDAPTALCLAYTALTDGRGPMCKEVARGETHYAMSVSVEDAIADDWTVSNTPPIKVLTPTPDGPAPDYALSVGGQLIPLAAAPDYTIDKYRTVTVLTLHDEQRRACGLDAPIPHVRPVRRPLLEL